MRAGDKESQAIISAGEDVEKATRVVGTHICKRLEQISEDLQRVASSLEAITSRYKYMSEDCKADV